VIYESYDLDEQAANFELASYLMVNDGSDLIASEYGAEPGQWWSGWETDLGAAEGERREWKGLLRRDFAGGIVIVNEPDAATATVKLPRRRWTDASGDRVKRRVSLEGRSALVLIRGGKLRRGKRGKR
jgi:hypothetical protein